MDGYCPAFFFFNSGIGFLTPSFDDIGPFFIFIFFNIVFCNFVYYFEYCFSLLNTFKTFESNNNLVGPSDQPKGQSRTTIDRVTQGYVQSCLQYLQGQDSKMSLGSFLKCLAINMKQNKTRVLKELPDVITGPL